LEISLKKEEVFSQQIMHEGKKKSGIKSGEEKPAEAM
jgi:hypothetical protein